jgi:hypothetical protein
MRSLTVVILCAVLVGGCIGPGATCRISVANASRRNISSVSVHDDAGASYVFRDLKAHTAGVEQAVEAGIAQNVKVEIVTEDGEGIEKTVDLGGVVPPNFAGDIILQLEDDGNVRTFVLPDNETGGKGDLPWATPPAWQGVMNVPGLTPPE